MPFVYHLCADDFRGTSLLPLNALRVAHPDVYDRECAKWAGRESVLQWQVPHLGVAWGDTVNLAALDPVHLIRARKRLGVPYSRLLERRVVRIPVQRIAHLPAVVYDSRSHWLNSRPGEKARPAPPEDEFTAFDAGTYQELLETPQLHLEYLSEQLAAGQPALGLYSFATSWLPARSTSAISRWTASDRRRGRPRGPGFRPTIGMVALAALTGMTGHQLG